MKPTIYVKCCKSKSIQNDEVRIGDIASIYCEDTHISNKVKSLRVATRPSEKSVRYVVSVLKVIELICVNFPGAQVESSGEADTVVEFVNRKGGSGIIEYLKVTLVCIITLVGGAFAIMAYNNDIGAPDLFMRVYKLVGGEYLMQYKVLELGYAIGLCLGILCFYGHIGNWKQGVEPTPLEVEMRLYEEDVDTAIIKQSDREEVTIDA